MECIFEDPDGEKRPHFPESSSSDPDPSEVPGLHYVIGSGKAILNGIDNHP